MTKLIWWDLKVGTEAYNDPVRALYDAFREMMHSGLQVSTLLLMMSSSDQCFRSNIRNVMESILDCEVIFVNDLVDALRVLKYVMKATRRSIGVTYFVPDRGFTMFVFSRKRRDKCFNIKFLDILSTDTYYMVDETTDVRAYYDFLSDIWIKDIVSTINNKVKPDPEAAIIGYTPIPRIILKVASALNLKSEGLKQLVQSLAKLSFNEGLLFALSSLSKALNEKDRILLIYLSRFMDKAVIAYVEKEK